MQKLGMSIILPGVTSLQIGHVVAAILGKRRNASGQAPVMLSFLQLAMC